jgi:nucleotide-binding universal stress UspA family protein
MKKILVPTDFSDVSKNAALFAARLAEQVPGSEIILFNALDAIEAGIDGTPLNVNTEARKKLSLAALANLKEAMNTTVPLTLVCDTGKLADLIENIHLATPLSMVIMGITGTSKIEQLLFGSNTLNVINRNICPVIIVPGNCTYRGFRNIVLATDLEETGNTIPSGELNMFLGWFKSKLYMVKVMDKHTSSHASEEITEKNKLSSMFSMHNPEFCFLRGDNFPDTINDFALDKKADALITIPKKHQMMSSLFNVTHTKKLAYHSYFPVIAFHAKG